jgi:hypothetical protein
MANNAFGNMAAAATPAAAAAIVYGIALEDSSGGTVLVRIGDEITASDAWGMGGGDWVEISPEDATSVEAVDLLSVDDDETEIIEADYQDSDTSDEQPADDANEHASDTSPLDSDNFDYAETEQPAWNDELLDETAAYTETMPDASSVVPSDNDYGDAANDPHVATIEQE